MSVPSGAGGQWMDVSGTAFDVLDRKKSEYHYIPGSDTIATHSYTFDSSALGLLGSETMPVGDAKSYTYDTAGRLSGASFGVSSFSTYTAGRTYSYDPDGRIASVGNPQFGTWQYSYDADGRLSSMAEPVGGGSGIPGAPYANSGVLTSASTYQYGYYANGWASQVQVQGTNAFTQQESYRSDGLPQTDYYSTISGSITRQYTPAGRITNRTDPSGSDSTTYDGYGREASQSVPSGTYSNFAYNDQGLPTSYRIYPVSGSYDEAHLLYNGTGQLACTQAYFNYYGSCNWLFDGAPIAFTSSYYAPDGNQYTNNSIVDTRNLLVVGTAVEDGSGSVAFSTSNAYDANTRITQTVSPTTYDQQGQGFDWAYQTDHTYQYDVEDHTTSVADYAATTSAQTNTHSYAWGPIGHPVTVGITSGGWLYEAMHWNGDALSFETRADASANDYKLSLDGDVLLGTTNYNGAGYSGATYYDRDASGLAFATHNPSGHSTFSLCNGGPASNSPGVALCQPIGTATGQQPGYYDSNSGTVLAYQHSDGITDGSATIQGARNHSSETSQWTTPDAYDGEIHDPMSQAKYMWNRNNPVAYADPTGYCSVDEGSGRCKTHHPQVTQQQMKAAISRALTHAEAQMAVGGIFTVVGGAQVGVERLFGGGAVETVIRYGAKGESEDVAAQLLVRGGRSGVNYVTNDIYTSARQAYQALQLPGMPEVRMEMTVGRGIFSGSQRVPGGFGTERTAAGPVRVLHLDVFGLRP